MLGLNSEKNTIMNRIVSRKGVLDVAETPATVSKLLYLVTLFWSLVSKVRTEWSPLVLEAKNILTMSNTLCGTS